MKARLNEYWPLFRLLRVNLPQLHFAPPFTAFSARARLLLPSSVRMPAFSMARHASMQSLGDGQLDVPVTSSHSQRLKPHSMNVAPNCGTTTLS